MRLFVKKISNRFKNKDAIKGLTLFFLFLIVYFVLIPMEVEVFSSEEALQANFFPKLLIIVLICFCGFLTLAGLKEGKGKSEGVIDVNSVSQRKESWKRVCLISISFIVYLAILRPVGFIISSLSFLLFAMNYYGSQKWLINIILSIIFVFAIYFVFRQILYVDLPQGILSF